MTITSKGCTQNESNGTMVHTIWEEQFGSGCGVKPRSGSGWGRHENNDANSMRWEHQKDYAWNTHHTHNENFFVNENDMETSIGWGKKPEPKKHLWSRKILSMERDNPSSPGERV